MPTKTATRPASSTANLPALLATTSALPLDQLGLFGGTPARGKRANGKAKDMHPAMEQIASDVRLAMAGRMFLLGSLHLLAQCFQEAGVIQETPVKTRAPYGSKTGGKRRKRRARKSAE